MVNDFIPAAANARSRRERHQLVVLGLLTIYEGLIAVLTLGHFSVSTRAWYLFDVLKDD